MSVRFTSKTATSLRLLTAIAACLTLAACGPAGQDKSPAISQKQQTPERVSDEQANQKVARIGDMEITRQMLEWFVRTSEDEKLREIRPLQADADALRFACERLAIVYEGSKRSLEIIDEISTETQATVEEFERRLLNETLFREIMPLDQLEVSEEEIRQFYEDNLSAFTQPFHFDMRHIFISNYERVVTEEGDTLEEIAQRISGDVSMVPRILIDTKMAAPRAPDWTPETGIQGKPLEPGEALLVPVAEEAKAERLERIREAKRRIEAGEDFIEVALELSDANVRGDLIKGVGIGGRPVLDSFMQAARQTPEGQVTDIFETKHGYNLMRIENKFEEHVKPLAEVRDEVIRALRGKKATEKAHAYIDQLINEADIEIDLEAWRRADATGEDQATTVARINGQVFTHSQLQMPALGPVGPETRREDLLPILRAHPDVREALVVQKARELNIPQTPYYRMTWLGSMGVKLTEAYLDRIRRQIAVREVTEEEQKKFFEQNVDEIWLPRRYDYYVLAMRIPEEQTQAPALAPEEATLMRMRQVIEGIETLDQFREAILEHSEDPQAQRHQGHIVGMDERNLHPDVARYLEESPVGTVTEPRAFPELRLVLCFWIADRSERRHPTFEEARRGLPNLIRNQDLQEFPTPQKQELLEASGLEMLL